MSAAMLRSAEEVALAHAIIGFEHVKQGIAQTIPEDVALCCSCGWMRLSDYTLHVADLIRARDAEIAEAVTAENARLREGVLRVLRETSDDFTAEDLADLLNPPTEGETDHE